MMVFEAEPDDVDETNPSETLHTSSGVNASAATSDVVVVLIPVVSESHVSSSSSDPD